MQSEKSENYNKDKFTLGLVGDEDQKKTTKRISNFSFLLIFFSLSHILNFSFYPHNKKQYKLPKKSNFFIDFYNAWVTNALKMK